MAVFQYVGRGTMRPTTRRSQLQRGKKSLYERLSDIDRAAEEAREIVRRELAEYEKQENFLEQVTPGGRYNSEIANSLAAQMGIVVSEPVKRGRGRPRKYGPNDPRPPRKSRAKVRVTASLVSDVVRGVSPSLRAPAERKPRRASSRTTSGTVSPVTAAPARIPTPAPKAAPKVAAALLESTLAGGLGQDTIQIETPETAFEIKPVETRTVQITVVENDPEYEAELAEQAALVKARLDAENEPGEELPLPSVRRTKFTRRYDFSDAKDASKVDPAVLALFPHFGLSTTSPSEEMSDEDMTKWIFATSYTDEPDEEYRQDRFKNDLRIYRSVGGVFKAKKFRLEREIQRERDRVAVWHVIDARVTDAEQFSDRAAKGEMSDDLARMWVAHLDYLALGNLEDSEHLVWREIVDAMEWPKGFSRIDLAIWAEQDPNVVPDVRSWAGEPKNFPERLRYVPFPP
ncbi:hypothetical protein [Microvirga tunisiensis]|uniref:Uncharacterized protein n=1 Tax=Microvirga tunisiensis TaxID=2108360 RepID=A0A5N7MV55_9HYPH|nr:hypothetical protein [Microvirga tunisiensis]MPR12421.1 hypothetical protein [Microvirga tunisiensis]MPR30349.1 hypothetical protein [Microvirga tunisiensis]